MEEYKLPASLVSRVLFDGSKVIECKTCSSDKEIWTATFGPLIQACCINCMFFVYMQFDSEFDDDNAGYNEPRCRMSMFDEVMNIDCSDLRESMHRQVLQQVGNNVYHEMLPIPSRAVFDDVPIFTQVGMLNSLLQGLGVEEIDLPEDDHLTKEELHKVFMSVGRTAKKLILDEGITRDEYDSHVVDAYTNCLPTVKNEVMERFGSVCNFVTWSLESTCCHRYASKNGQNVSVIDMVEEIERTY